MAGILSVAKFKELMPSTSLTDAQIETYLAAAQAIAEQISGLVFGAQVTGVASSGGTYTLTISTPVGAVGDQIRLIGNGAPTTLFTITEIGDTFVKFASATVGLNPTKVLPVVEFIGQPSSGYVKCAPRPVFSVVSVQVRSNPELMWNSPDIQSLTSTQYEVYANAYTGIRLGVRLAPSAVPKMAESGPWLVKHMTTGVPDGVRVLYTAGFFAMVPADIQTAAAALAVSISKNVKDGGVFASENMDYYSYQTLSYEQMALLPQSAIATFKRYSR